MNSSSHGTGRSSRIDEARAPFGISVAAFQMWICARCETANPNLAVTCEVCNLNRTDCQKRPLSAKRRVTVLVRSINGKRLKRKHFLIRRAGDMRTNLVRFILLLFWLAFIVGAAIWALQTK